MGIKKIINNYRVQIGNFGYLSLLQLVSLFLPLLTYPYLIRVLSVEIYGEVVFAQALMAYFSIIINYGFNIYGTKEVAIHKHNKKTVSEIISSVFILKLMLSVFCFLVLLFLVFLVPPFNCNKTLYLLSFLVCFNEILFQQYFFQGIEKMKYITYINLVSRLIFFIFIFVLIKSESDYLLIPILNGLGAIVGGLIAFYIIIKDECVTLKYQSLHKLIYYFKKSTPFFVSRFSSILIDQTNTILLGSYVGYVEVSYYDLGKKILNVLLIPFNILNQVLYPFVSRTKDMRFMRKILYFVFVSSLLLYFLFYLFRKFIVLCLGGEDMIGAIQIVSILNLGLIFTSLSYFLGNTILVVMGKIKSFNYSVLLTAALYLILIGIAYKYNTINIVFLSVISVICALCTCLYRLYSVVNYKILKF